MTLDDAIADVLRLIRRDYTPGAAAEIVIDRLNPVDLRQAAIEHLKRIAVSHVRRDELVVERAAVKIPYSKPHQGNRCDCEACSEWLKGTPRGRHPRRCQCDECERWAEICDRIDRESSTKLWDKIGEIVADYTARMRMEWTAELLAQTFRMPDGSKVTWGQASIEQHQERIDMLQRNAKANIEAAARHHKAITDISAAGTDTLAALIAANQ